MRVLILGATGMVGQGVLRECLRDPGVSEVIALGRAGTGQSHPKLRDLVVPDLFDLSAVEDELAGIDACFWCLGVSSAGMSEAAYARVTYDLTASVAARLVRRSPGAVFVFVSGAGADSSERGRTMWARVKGRAENAVLAMPFRAVYVFRPAMIIPMHGIRSRTGWYNALYAVLKPLLPLFRTVAPGMVSTTEQVGRAMLRVVREGYPKRVLESKDITRL